MPGWSLTVCGGLGLKGSLLGTIKPCAGGTGFKDRGEGMSLWKWAL